MMFGGEQCCGNSGAQGGDGGDAMASVLVGQSTWVLPARQLIGRTQLGN